MWSQPVCGFAAHERSCRTIYKNPSASRTSVVSESLSGHFSFQAETLRVASPSEQEGETAAPNSRPLLPFGLCMESQYHSQSQRERCSRGFQTHISDSLPSVLSTDHDVAFSSVTGNFIWQMQRGRVERDRKACERGSAVSAICVLS